MPFVIFLLCVLSLAASAKVDPANYEFSTDTLSDFFPGKKISEIEAKYGKGDVMKEGDVKMIRFWVSQIRYKFPVIVQADQENVLDMFATLPTYFLHDVFHQSLIKRWGKQKTYKRVDEEAYYRWSDEEKVMHYAAACTITCFRLYFSVAPSKEKSSGGFTSQYEQLQKATKP